ncbi:MAG: sigma 54-interacting transcriptional regulator [Thermodesulfovibrionales bacterium]|nr:sigma 54-interacting transcriptional regulator [Thermodesulfovibrionales bacterium]
MFNQQRNKELSAILEASKVLTASFNLEKNLTSVMEILGSHLEMQRGCVYLLEPISKELMIVAAYGLTKTELAKGKYHIGEGIVGKVIEGGSPMFIPNIGKEPRFLNRTGSRPKKDGISFICVPIKLKSEIFGVLSVDRIYSEKHGGVDDDIRVLNIVSSLIAQFVKLWEIYKKTNDEKETLKGHLKERYNVPSLIGESDKFRSVLQASLKVADTDATILLLGETGTGKELIAKTIHFQSRRANGPFIAVNCAAIPENLLEAELFGAEKGAFTGANERRIGRFEFASGGTILLDEVGEISSAIQAKLLRVLQEKTFERVGSSRSLKADVRVIAATNRNLAEEITRGNFRADLYWRLNVVSIMLPPIRKRKEDIPLLVNYYLKKFNNQYQKKIQISDDVMERFKGYVWTGNIRELANTIERLVIMADTEIIQNINLPDSSIPEHQSHYSEGITSLEKEVEFIERERLCAALKANNYIQSRAAKDIGITPRQLGYKLKKFGIDLKSLEGGD